MYQDTTHLATLASSLCGSCEISDCDRRASNTICFMIFWNEHARPSSADDALDMRAECAKIRRPTRATTSSRLGTWKLCRNNYHLSRLQVIRYIGTLSLELVVDELNGGPGYIFDISLCWVVCLLSKGKFEIGDQFPFHIVSQCLTLAARFSLRL